MEPELRSEAFLCDLFGKKDQEADFKKCLRRLARLHWLMERDGGYSCHPVIAETARVQLTPKAENCTVLIENVINLLKPDEEKHEPIIRRALFGPLGETVFKGVWREGGDFTKEDEVIVRLAVWLAKLYHSLGAYRKCIEYDQKALNIRGKILPPEHQDLAQSYNNLALAYHDLGDLDQACTYLRKAVVILEKALPAEHPHLLLVKANLEDMEHKRRERN